MKKMEYGKYSLLLNELVRKLNVLNKDQKVCYGLTVPQCYTIETVGKDGKLSMNELSTRLGVSISTMTRVVDVLVRDDILERSEKPGDRRKVCIDLTDKGRDLEKKLRECSESYAREILDAIPEDKREAILESLELLVNAVESVKQKCCRYI